MGASYSDSREEEEAAARRRETRAMEYEDMQGKFKRQNSFERREMEVKVAQSNAKLAQQADYLESMYMKQLEEEKGEMEKKMTSLQADFKKEVKTMAEEKAALMIKTNEARAECERLAAEKVQMFKHMTEFRDLCERTLQEGKEEMAKKQEEMARQLAQSRLEMDTKMNNEKAAAEQKLQEFHLKMMQEKASAEQKLADFRLQAEDQLRAERQEMAQQLESTRQEMAKQTAEEKASAEQKLFEFRMKMTQEKASAEKKLLDFRLQTEAQLETERQVTHEIKECLRELPPLQTAMELGDLGLLNEEVQKWNADELPDRFGDCKGVVEAVVKLARERLVTWRGVANTVQEVLKESERTGGSVPTLAELCRRLMRAMKEAQLTKMDIFRSDPTVMEKLLKVFYKWQETAMSFPNNVQRCIVHKVVTCPQFGAFLFVDMDICLRLVDRSEDGNDIFLSRAQALVEDKKTTPKDLKPLLAHLETMLFFLKYAKLEDLQLTHTEFQNQISSGLLEPSVAGHLKWALSAYPPGAELAQLSDSRSLLDHGAVAAVLEEIRKAPTGSKDGLGFFREIFYHWAIAMRGKFDLLVLPHHTQVVCLLAFRRFLEVADQSGPETARRSPHALIAQVGTGEGKSMIIAVLAIYVVVVLRKKVHIVIDDETLLERDFFTFKPLFDSFEVPVSSGRTKRPLTSMCCVREELATGDYKSCLAPRIDPEADVCYCEGKHVQSFYASIARSDKCDFSGYKDRVIIADEVDALVIDEEPNEAFVYPNEDLSKMATLVAGALNTGASAESATQGQSFLHPATGRVVREMKAAWQEGLDMSPGEDFVYVKEVGKNCVLNAGRANPNTWSLALECRNFQDGHVREILFQERLFVMSRPRVFRMYYRLLGVSGSIGSEAERKFLKETYRASFFEVPPFLKTCRGSPFHSAVAAQLGSKKHAVYVESSASEQVRRLAEVALEAREQVPVLVIAKDRTVADQLVESLRLVARSRGLGTASEDAVRSLSRTLYESDPEQWKENLNRSTLPLGDAAQQGGGSWRITVTDPRGGRGTDYRVDDQEVDGRGGLLLIPTFVPTTQREWVQFLGRTARQDRKGQFCAVLCGADYADLSKKYRYVLVGGPNLVAIDTILGWGDRECTERIQASAALFNCGVRVNELCEEIFGRRVDLLKDVNVREALVAVCQSFRYLSVPEIDDAFAQIPGLNPAEVKTEAVDLGAPMSAPVVVKSALGQPSAKIVIFALDWSASMQSNDTGTNLNRFQTCVRCVMRILNDQVRDPDLVGIVGFGANVRIVVQPIAKKAGHAKLGAEIGRLSPERGGGTCFFDAVSSCLQLMGGSQVAPANWARWLVCLTDGDDIGSRIQNCRGQEVTRMIESRSIKNLNTVFITVGRLKEHNVKIIDTWVERVCSFGGLGRHVSEKDAAAIEMAFDVVAECLAADVGGAVEL